MKAKTRGVHRKPEKIFPADEADDRIYDVFRNHGFGDYPHEKRRQLTEFYLILMQFQKTMNLTRLIEIRDVALKHFIDCLMVPKLYPLSFPLLDVGSGAGFPGIPLKIEFPESKIVLAEGVGKRVEFLKIVRDRLGLSQLDIIGRYIDTSYQMPTQCVITRAVAPVDVSLSQLESCVVSGGTVVFMKGPKADEEMRSWLKNPNPAFYFEKSISYHLPNSPHERRLLVFRKC